MKTLRQIQTEAVRIARSKHGIAQYSLNIIDELKLNLNDLAKNPHHKSKTVETFNNLLRLMSSQDMSGDDALVMAEQANRLEEMKLEHSKQ